MSQFAIFSKGFLFGIVLTVAIVRRIEMSYSQRIKEIKKIRSMYTNVLYLIIFRK